MCSNILGRLYKESAVYSGTEHPSRAAAWKVEGRPDAEKGGVPSIVLGDVRTHL